MGALNGLIFIALLSCYFCGSFFVLILCFAAFAHLKNANLLLVKHAFIKVNRKRNFQARRKYRISCS